MGIGTDMAQPRPEKNITMAIAGELAAAVEECQAKGYAVTATVVDRAGQVKDRLKEFVPGYSRLRGGGLADPDGIGLERSGQEPCTMRTSKFIGYPLSIVLLFASLAPSGAAAMSGKPGPNERDRALISAAGKGDARAVNREHHSPRTCRAARDGKIPEAQRE